MGNTTFEGLALCVSDWEEDYLYPLMDHTKNPFPGMSSLIRAAGGETVGGSTPCAFELEGDPRHPVPEVEPTEGQLASGAVSYEARFWKTVRDDYRAETGRKNPPVMRVKVTVEVEMLTDEEAGKVWREHVRQDRAQRDEPATPWENTGVTSP